MPATPGPRPPLLSCSRTHPAATQYPRHANAAAAAVRENASGGNYHCMDYQNEGEHADQAVGQALVAGKDFQPVRSPC